MHLTQLLQSETNLTYSLATTPSPVQVSPETGDPSRVALTFVVSAADPTILVQSIAITLPVGDPKNPLATDLTEVVAGIQSSVQPSAQWQLGPGIAPGTFVAKPLGGAPITIGSGLTITIYAIQVNQMVGNAQIKITEVTSASPAPASCTIKVPKFPYGFFAGNFSSTAPTVSHGGTATLSWTGSEDNATYTMLWGTSTLDVTSVRQWVSPALTDDTTFMLQVVAQVLGESVTEYFTTTVIVSNPDLTATSLQVLTTSTLQGAVTAAGPAVVQGGLSVAGGATVTGAVAAINPGYQQLQVSQSPFHAPTDGFLIGYVYPSYPNPDTTFYVNSTILGVVQDPNDASNTIFVEATGGGTVAVVIPTLTYPFPTSGTFMLPVPKGWICGFAIETPSFPNPLPGPMPQVSFYWFPIGVGTPIPSQSTLEKIVPNRGAKTSAPTPPTE